MKCSKCGYELNENDLFCPRCGAKVEQETNQPEVSKPDTFKKYLPFVIAAIVLVVAVGIIYPLTNKNMRYNSVDSLLNKGKYDQAISTLENLEDYKDSKTYLEYAKAFKDFGEGNYDEAIEKFTSLENFHDADKMAIYSKALQNFEKTNYKTVIDLLTPMEDFKDSKTYIDYSLAKMNLNQRNLQDALTAFESLKNSSIKEFKNIGKDYSEYLNGMILAEAKDYASAIEIFNKLTNSKVEDLGDKATKYLSFIEGLKLYDNGDKYEAYQVFNTLRGFENATSYANQCSAERPKSKTIYRNKKYKSSAMSMKFKNNFDEDIFLKIYTTKDVLAGSIYVRAHSKATIKLKAGNYVIKEAIGDYDYWFGPDYAFGPKGSYYVLQLTSKHDYYKFKKNYIYTITLGTTGGNVGSTYESFENF